MIIFAQILMSKGREIRSGREMDEKKRFDF